MVVRKVLMIFGAICIASCAPLLGRQRVVDDVYNQRRLGNEWAQFSISGANMSASVEGAETSDIFISVMIKSACRLSQFGVSFATDSGSLALVEKGVPSSHSNARFIWIDSTAYSYLNIDSLAVASADYALKSYSFQMPRFQPDAIVMQANCDGDSSRTSRIAVSRTQRVRTFYKWLGWLE